MCGSVAGAAVPGSSAAHAGGGQPHSQLQFLFLERGSEAVHTIFICADHFTNPPLLVFPVIGSSEDGEKD